VSVNLTQKSTASTAGASDGLARQQLGVERTKTERRSNDAIGPVADLEHVGAFVMQHFLFWCPAPRPSMAELTDFADAYLSLELGMDDTRLQAAIAIANKTSRIAWAIMVHGGAYEAGGSPLSGSFALPTFRGNGQSNIGHRRS
jgi:hypothetical protein